MPAAAVISNQVYRPGETPIFMALIVKGDGTPLTRADVKDIDNETMMEYITVTHMEKRDGIKNGIIVHDWFPVEHPEGYLEDIPISRFCIYDTLVPIDETDALVYIQGVGKTPWDRSVTPITHYNFVYIPVDGHRYYPRYGEYQTVFKFELLNGGIDIVPFKSFANDQDVDGNDILVRESSEVLYGEDILFEGELYTKFKEPEQKDDGQGNLILNIVNNVDQRGRLDLADTFKYTENVYLSVFNVTTNQRLINKEPLDACVIIPDAIVDDGDKNFYYTFPTTRLPMAGLYRFRFEVKAMESIVCTFDIDVSVI